MLLQLFTSFEDVSQEYNDQQTTTDEHPPWFWIDTEAVLQELALLLRILVTIFMPNSSDDDAAKWGNPLPA